VSVSICAFAIPWETAKYPLFFEGTQSLYQFQREMRSKLLEPLPSSSFVAFSIIGHTTQVWEFFICEIRLGLWDRQTLSLMQNALVAICNHELAGQYRIKPPSIKE